jgi:large subunit ribosomal protein L44e
MKLPKETNRYCPYCRKHTAQLVTTAKQKSRSSTHPLSRGSSSRLKSRGIRMGYGNQGRYSRKGPKDWKMKTKITKRISVQYKCKTCNKIKGIRKAIRAGRIEIGEKISK